MSSNRTDTPALPPEMAGARIAEFPLRGEWVAVNTPGTRIPSHGTNMLAQRYAFDLMRLDRRRRYHPAGLLRTLVLGVPTRECLGWGSRSTRCSRERSSRPSTACGAGRIHPVRELAVVGWNALTFTATRLPAVVGNHVIVRHGDVWSAYVHLTTGSVAVRVGQNVDAGEVIGRLGHTGNSTAPHLHVQLMDGPEPLTARGVPFVFRAYEVETEVGWVRVEGAVPSATDRIRSVPAP